VSDTVQPAVVVSSVNQQKRKVLPDRRTAKFCGGEWELQASAGTYGVPSVHDFLLVARLADVEGGYPCLSLSGRSLAIPVQASRFQISLPK
jgi:hypothetical protein